MNSVKAIIYQSEVDFITKWVQEFPNQETGGDFFGHWTEEGIPVVEFVIGPGRKAARTSTSFFQDVDYLKEWGHLIKEMAPGLRQIGAWHSHHRLSLDHPSSGDVNTMRRALSGDLTRFLISICNLNGQNSVSINAFLFLKDLQGDYLNCQWEIREGISPLRKRLNDDDDLVEKPIPLEPEPVRESDQRQEEQLSRPALESDSYWRTKEGKTFLKKVYDNINHRPDVTNTEILQLPDGRIAITFEFQGRNLRIAYPDNFPNSLPQITIREPKDTYGIVDSFFGTKKKFDKKVRDLIYTSGAITDKGIIVLNHEDGLD